MNQSVILGILVICGVYTITISILTTVNGLRGKILLKVIPFFTGLIVLLYAILSYFGVL